VVLDPPSLDVSEVNMSEVQVKGKESRRGQSEGREQTPRRTAGEGLAPRGGSPWLSFRPGDLWSMNPWELMRRFSEDMDRAFQDWPGAGGREAMGFVPPVEVFERGNDLVVRAELPGVQPNEVKAELTDEGLLIEGERRRDVEDQGEGFYRSEHSYGRFRRLIQLPADVDPEKAKATFKDGVLEVHVPVPESKTRRRRIPISEGTASGSRPSTEPSPETPGQTSRETTRDTAREPDMAGAGASAKGGAR
jgi:HSP20 family protein